MNPIADSIHEVKEKMAAAAGRSGRSAEAVELVAVSKTFPAEVVREAARTPHELFGESRAQEAVAKIPECPPHLRWHFIGHLQRNKARRILPLVEAVHSIDSPELAGDLDRLSAEIGRRLDIYLQVNVAGDAAKFGLSPEALDRHLDVLLSLERLSVVGLMTIPPLVAKPELSRRHFAALRELRDRLETQAGTTISGLSMGMSDDYEIAIEEGATIVRVGSAIFGKRRSVIRRSVED
jgi:pyridoxal phosphate enzyme (YggS family)